ncbi:MAG TPA: TlyA family rRNA (cytidine-2'-O)-methyltransferase [Candidatus Yonathbacteria bacterium]|nr:TlyA family rRNA (cytidine-2'-O)-methyltransferase [Candidatus Yonathbacteria bacterium]
MKKRADIVVTEQGLTKSRTAAAELIRTGNIIADNATVKKPSDLISPDAKIQIITELPYVGRGGVKLAHALDTFHIKVSGKTLVDIGASTGGFTDCALQYGAKKIYAVDVGHSQLAEELRKDPRVIVMERTDIRTVTLPERVDLAVIDVSFISLVHILPRTKELLAPHGEVVALIKPQFEVGREHVGKQGVVKNEQAQKEALHTVLENAEDLGFSVQGITESPILGGTGNKEFLAYFTLSPVS